MNEAFNHLANELTKARARGYLRTGLALFGFAVFLHGIPAYLFVAIGAWLVLSFVLVSLLRNRPYQVAKRVVQFLIGTDVDGIAMFLAFLSLAFVLFRQDSFSLYVCGLLTSVFGCIVLIVDLFDRFSKLGSAVRDWVAGRQG
jgi:hypothetical protein